MKLNFGFLFYCIYFNLSVSCVFYNLVGRPGEGYIIEVTIGTPPQKFNVLVDTGSTNFAIAGAPHPNVDSYFVRSNSTTNVDLGEQVLLLYTQGRWSGDLASDVVYFPTLNSVPQVTCDIAFITASQSFFMNGSNWQGILGLAYPAIARPSSSVKPWIDSLQRKNKDKTIAFSLTLCGSKRPGMNNHYGSFEVLNNMKNPYIGIQTARVVREWFYEVIITSLLVEGQAVPVDCRSLNTDKSIVDSGTTNIRLPKNVFKSFVEILIPATKKAYMMTKEKRASIQKLFPNKTGPFLSNEYEIEEWNLPEEFWWQQKTVCWPQQLNWDGMPTVNIEIASTPDQYFRINLPGSSYIRQVYEKPGPQFCYKFSIEPSEMGTILGVAALEGFQVIFNRTARTVGFLKSDCGPPVSLLGPYSVTDNVIGDDEMGLFSKCAHADIVRVSMLNIAAYIVCGVLLLASCMFAYLFAQWLKNKYFKYHVSGTAVSMSHASLINEES